MGCILSCKCGAGSFTGEDQVRVRVIVYVSPNVYVCCTTYISHFSLNREMSYREGEFTIVIYSLRPQNYCFSQSHTRLLGR